MKRVVVIIILIQAICPTGWTQNYAPFHEDVSKRFFEVGNPNGNNYFFYADSVQTIGTNKLFYQYHSIQDMASPSSVDECGWGGGWDWVADTTWLGNTFIYDTLSKHLLLFNDQLNPLDFDFSISMGDSSLFYQDSMNRYYIKLINSVVEPVFSLTDSVRTYLILHLDSNNVPVISPLHNTSIKLAKSLGLIRFLEVYNFPLVETSVTLQGQLNPLIGKYQITWDDVYPFDIGDSLQFEGTLNDGWFTYCKYRHTYYVTNRSETATNVQISFGHWFGWTQTYGTYPCTYISPYGSEITYTKNQDIIGKPYNHILHEGIPMPTFWFQGSTANLTCDTAESFTHDFRPAGYCDTCKCYFAPEGWVEFGQTNYSAGLGITYDYYMNYWNDISTILTLTYARVGGVECGIYHSIGFENQTVEKLTIYPNPATDFISIDGLTATVNYELIDVNGKVEQNGLTSQYIDIRTLPSGIHFLRIGTKYSKIVKQ